MIIEKGIIHWPRNNFLDKKIHIAYSQNWMEPLVIWERNHSPGQKLVPCHFSDSGGHHLSKKVHIAYSQNLMEPLVIGERNHSPVQKLLPCYFSNSWGHRLFKKVHITYRQNFDGTSGHRSWESSTRPEIGSFPFFWLLRSPPFQKGTYCI